MVQVVHIKMSDSLENNSETPIHYIPCKVHFDGNANVSKYFLHSTDKGGHSTDKGSKQSPILIPIFCFSQNLIIT